MVILGLGSNVGDRLANLRTALQSIKKISHLKVQQVSPIYVSDALMPENAPAEWDMPYLNLALRCETTLKPVDLLKQLKDIEWSIGRKPEIRHWGPRIIDIDILAWDNLTIQTDMLTVPHASLQERPFALWPLADVAPLWIFPLAGVNQGKTAAQIVESWGSRFSGKAPFRTKQVHHRIDTPQLMGIVNITPDSFSDGGKFLNPEQAFEHIIHLVNAGAEVIDMGAESTAPTAQPLDAKTEWARLEPVLTAIKKSTKQNFLITPKISIDTRHSFVAANALDRGADWINDVSGLDDPVMCEIIAQSTVDCVVMHHLSIPERRDHTLPRDLDPVKMVQTWGEKRLRELEQKGIARNRIIFDPGIGFGKMAEQSLLLLKNVNFFKSLGTRILIGHSRKTFISLLSEMPFVERDIETMAMALYLSKQSVDYIRVHNVEFCARGFKITAALENFEDKS
ncbi:MAG: dihydropteroate synthase [Gammaproteobacteria bacterium]|nr:dihydropteroate synthase [Gammaproteobacteria bacterium]MCW5582888.1 dihydropteroate synthase [Gammaproteobacteria bacterium]